MRWLPVLAALLSLGCARFRPEVKREEGYSLAAYRKVAVPAFVDPSGRGAAVAEALRAKLRALPQGVADPAAVDPILASKGDASVGLEQIERLKFQAGADALVVGRMAGDWSSASVLVYELELGDVMLRGVVRPENGRKAFTGPDEAAARVLAALVGRR